MNDSAGDNQNELFTWVVKAGSNRLYYLNVKNDRNKDLYLVIKETKRLQDGSREVHRIMVFEKDLKKFVNGLKEVLQYINSLGLIDEDNNGVNTDAQNKVSNLDKSELSNKEINDITQMDEIEDIRSEFEV
jgi:hypothetical protein